MGKVKGGTWSYRDSILQETGAPPTLGALVKRANDIVAGERNQYLNRYAFGVSFFNLAFRRNT